ncbi:ABC-F family ATP-binding cassette domain-containing protein [Candidatus Peregrinibacteria bacterium]|nr:ABC-F family ATP-binding cassette domain-containing protein [Candidatus Peregrinibacteria bacterium]MBT4366255.1 ABC-F family ATP-binding cassette domain-containing protein [Candidatus Peregrinibacteria bacterium]MBT4456349.1 ABC-F family ATP-binding cassette domain-containing protein [Candidatus Peregrinibacteria bacterium]
MATLLQINGLSKSYGAQTILEDAGLVINERQKIGVIGRNGAGKSTLFKIIVGNEELDEGTVNVHEGTRIGYLTQHSEYEEDESVIDYLMRSSGKKDWECGKMAGSFQIKGEQLDAKVVSLAGGYQMRVKLIATLLKDPNLLLLDEPTNYLDLSTQLLLEHFLRNYKGSVLLISHDREFIKRTCNETVEIEHGKITLYPRSIEEYLVYKEEQLSRIEGLNIKTEQKKKHLQSFVDRFGAKASKASQAQSKMKQIEKLKTIEVNHPLSTTTIVIPPAEDKKGIALKTENLEIGYSDKSIAQEINLEIERGQKIAVLGDNGQGKTTLLKTLAGEIDKLSGNYKWGHNIKIAYYAQHIPATLNSNETVKAYLKRIAPPDISEQDIFKMAGNFLFKDEALKKKLPVLSGGEKARLCLAKILLQKNQVILLDEPTNHLDFETVEALAQALRDSNVTIIFVSHNRTFVEIVANGIVEVKNARVTRYHHNYEEYVYHLQKNIEEDLGIIEEPPLNLEKEERKALIKKVKEVKKRLKYLEKEIIGLEEEKTILLEWFEENPTEYSEEKTKRLAEIEKKIIEKEQEWMEAEIDLEVKQG